MDDVWCKWAAVGFWAGRQVRSGNLGTVVWVGRVKGTLERWIAGGEWAAGHFWGREEKKGRKNGSQRGSFLQTRSNQSRLPR
jgi:hypothetical protein